MAAIEGTALVARTALDGPRGVLKTKALLMKALKYQLRNKGFSLLEVLAPCPTNWRMSPLQSLQWLSREMAKVFPPGVLKDSPGGDGA
jgi:2-oxoglutarate ferredoxin oxidoreductase subunit beta